MDIKQYKYHPISFSNTIVLLIIRWLFLELDATICDGNNY